MPPMKECFGQLGNMSIRYRDQSKQHYLRVDDVKLKECDTCNLFTKCMFLKYNELIREVLQKLDEKTGGSPRL
ncbi:MAG: hypothetical protein AMXMBFR84_05370 [Candidatus Hydrogenedentota bacterium]